MIEIIDYRDILGMDKEGLDYRKIDKSLGRIEFKICHQNWKHYVETSEDFSRENHASYEGVGVGERDITANPPVFNLFSDPPLKIEFKFGFFTRNKVLKKFEKFRIKLQEFGWSSFDLS